MIANEMVMGKMKKKKTNLFKQEERVAFLFILIPLIGFSLFTLFSMGASFYYSFTNFNPLRDNVKFVLFDNYIKMFKDIEFWEACLNTILLMASLPIGMFLGLLLAVYLKNLSHGSKALRIIYYLPVVTSAVAVNLVWRYIFQANSGLFNLVLGLTHVNNGGPIYWLGTNKWLIKAALVIKNTWGGIGSTMILYLAGLNNISDSYYEAADIDGASNFEKFKYITLPLVKPTTFYLLITGVIGGLQSYTDAVVFAEGHEGTRTIVWYIWNYGINNSRYGYASAVSAFLAVVIMIITIIQFKKTKMLDI